MRRVVALHDATDEDYELTVRLLDERKDDAELVKVLGEILACDEWPRGFFLRASAHERLGDHARARADARRCIELAPDAPEAIPARKIVER